MEVQPVVHWSWHRGDGGGGGGSGSSNTTVLSTETNILISHDSRCGDGDKKK